MVQILFIKTVLKIYFLTLNLLFITNYFSSQKKHLACPICEFPKGNLVLKVNISNVNYYDNRKIANYFYQLKFLGKYSRVKNISSLNYMACYFFKNYFYRCSKCFTIYSCGVKILNRFVPQDDNFYDEGYRFGVKFGRQHMVNTKRVINFTKLISKYLPDKGKLLDVGCAEGATLHSLKVNGFKVVGIEPSEPMVNFGREELELTENEIFQGYYKFSTFPNNYFNGIICYHVIEHIKAPKEFLENFFRHLVGGGYVFLSTPSAELSMNYFELTGRNLNFHDGHLILTSTKKYLEFITLIGFQIIDVISNIPLENQEKINFSGEKPCGVTFILKKPIII